MRKLNLFCFSLLTSKETRLICSHCRCLCTSKVMDFKSSGRWNCFPKASIFQELWFLPLKICPFNVFQQKNGQAPHMGWISKLPYYDFSLVQVSTVSRSECVTWGNFHFHTFDHVKFTFPGTCTYVFASHCNDSYQDFNIQIRRSAKNSFLIYFTVTIDGVVLEVKETGITVNGKKWVKTEMLFWAAFLLLRARWSDWKAAAVYEMYGFLNRVLWRATPLVFGKARGI